MAKKKTEAPAAVLIEGGLINIGGASVRYDQIESVEISARNGDGFTSVLVNGLSGRVYSQTFEKKDDLAKAIEAGQDPEEVYQESQDEAIAAKQEIAIALQSLYS